MKGNSELGSWPMDIEDEPQVVEAALRGDVDSFGKLYERYYATMVWLAYSILKDYDLAEDTAQEAFATACDELARLKNSEKFGNWLAAICRNVAYKNAKKRNKEIAVNDPAVVFEQSNDPGSEEAVREAIASLPEMYRETVILHYYNRMSYAQMELVLGIPKSRVKGRLFAARRKIGKYLQSRGLDGDD